MTMVKKILTVFSAVFLSFAAINVLAQKNQTEPALPLTTVDTTPVTPTGATITVGSGGDFQAALNSASPGDVITLAAGATYSGAFTLPVKSGSTYITVKTAGFSTTGRLVPGAGMLARISASSSDPALQCAAGAHHFRFIGIEFDAPGIYIDTLILLGSSSETVLANQPHHIIFDRCYIHGDANAGGKRGVSFQGSHLGVIDSYLSDWKGVEYDTQAIAGWNGPGPFKIANNYLEGAGENVMFGGADTVITNLTPSDIEVRGNTFFKPLSWKPGDPSYAGIKWSVKNLLELKHAQRVLIEGNTFENCWADTQPGFAILFTVRNQSGTNPWATLSDVTFRHNKLLNSTNGINLLGNDNESGIPSQTARRLLISNNLITNIGSDPGTGILFQILSGYEDVVIDHNTALHTGTTISADGIPSPRLTFTNNIVQHNQYGIKGSGQNPGNSTITVYFPDSVITANAFQSTVLGGAPYYPAGNFFPVNLSDIGFVNYPTDPQLKTTSSYYNQGTDGTSPGVQGEEMP
jgi:hypothetical protein